MTDDDASRTGQRTRIGLAPRQGYGCSRLHDSIRRGSSSTAPRRGGARWGALVGFSSAAGVATRRGEVVSRRSGMGEAVDKVTRHVYLKFRLFLPTS